MKRNVLVFAALAVLSTSAHATKARMEALGQDSVRGSEYISDSRNVFRNPAVLNQTKNYLVTEWGTSSAADDAANAPRAEGGFFREMGSFSYGLYLGNNEFANGRTALVNQYLTQTNALDLFLSGDMGLQWGARLHYANSKDEATSAFEKKNNAFAIGLGVVMGEAEVYTDITLADKSTGAVTAANEFKTKPSYLVGGSYKWAGNTFFASYENQKVEVTGPAVAGVTSGTSKDSIIKVGAGRIHEINPTARIISDATLAFETFTTPAGKEKASALPVTLGFEADATSWLVLRGSVHQNVILNSIKDVNGKKSTNANTTGVDAGATLNFGKLKVDGTIGTTSPANAQTAGGTNTGTLSLNNLLTRVGVSYMF